jgi:hypothetical protein
MVQDYIIFAPKARSRPTTWRHEGEGCSDDQGDETNEWFCRFPSRKEVRQAEPSDTATLSIFLVAEIEDLNRETNSQ